MPRYIRIRNSLAPLLHPLQTPAPAHPLAGQPTPNDHLRTLPLPPNVRLADISKGVLPREWDGGGRRHSESPGLSRFGRKHEMRMLMRGDSRLTEQQKVIKDERKHWDKAELRQLRNGGGLRWALRER